MNTTSALKFSATVSMPSVIARPMLSAEECTPGRYLKGEASLAHMELELRYIIARRAFDDKRAGLIKAALSWEISEEDAEKLLTQLDEENERIAAQRERRRSVRISQIIPIKACPALTEIGR